MKRLFQQIAESDYEPPARKRRASEERNSLDADAVVEFVRQQGRSVSRHEIEQALGFEASTRRWSRLMQRLTRSHALDAKGYGRARRYWTP
jgi:hypothetical protein